MLRTDPSGLEWWVHRRTGEVIWFPPNQQVPEYDYYKAPEYYRSEVTGRWNHLRMSGPTKNPKDSFFKRNGFEIVNAAQVPKEFKQNPSNEKLPALTDDSPQDQQLRDNINITNRRQIAYWIDAAIENNWDVETNPTYNFGNAERNLIEHGGEPFVDWNIIEHGSGSNYEIQVNGTWYHVTLGRTDWDAEVDLTDHHFVQIHNEDHFYRPSGGHRIFIPVITDFHR
jgi:hypothetical protein